MNTKFFLYFSFAYALFIIYGSLVPLDYRAIPFADALLSFQAIPYLDLGAASRADWIANILLYIPLTFSLAAAITNKAKPFAFTLFISTLILACSIFLAVSIEFYQQYFPPRTVSQNDLIAESLGSIIGLVLWLSYEKHLTKLYQHILHGGKNALLASAVLYALAYLALSFFPYDFVTSAHELHDKLNKGNDAFFISNSCGDFIQCSSKLTTEIILALPLGIFFSVFLKWHPKRLTAVIIIGFLLGLVIEGIQLFVISGIAQGISIMTRIIGMILGEKIYSRAKQLQDPFAFLNAVNLKKYLLILSLPYLVILASLNGWSLSENTHNPDISGSFNNINWLPFYYHYYTTEAVALTSLLSIFAMYFPIGIALWLWKFNKNPSRTYNLHAGLYASCLCLLMESGKLFFILKHPDPTNLIISFVSAALGYYLLEIMYHWLHQPEMPPDTQTNESSATQALKTLQPKQASKKHPIAKTPSSNAFAKSSALFLLALLLWQLSHYPDSATALLAALLLYGLALRKFPQTWLIAIPTLLPIADLSPWTGRIFFTEFDYFFILTLAISLWYGRFQSPLKQKQSSAFFLLAIYTFFYLISVVQGLLPFQSIDANAFSNYYSQYNSLRVAKGFIWALFLLPLLTYSLNAKHNIKSYLSYGILTGLTISSLLGIWERLVFTSLFDFSTDFRITSSFYSMHTGGAHLDAYLMLSMPFICFLLFKSKNVLLATVIPALLFSISLYTLLVTYTRGTYIAFVFAFITLLIALFVCYKDAMINNSKKMLYLPLLLILWATITIPVLKGSFIQHRFEQTNQEINTRSNHWIEAKNMMDNDLFTSLFGMGLGSFPRTYLWKNFSDNAPATFNLQQENNESYLQLGSGTALYIEQQINISANTQYNLSLDFRSPTDNSPLNIALCEKAVQNSFRCQALTIAAQNTQNQWQHIEQSFITKDIGKTNTSILNKPTKLILSNTQKNTIIDISNISLTTSEQTNLIKNGDFSKGMDFWFFTADQHIPWRTENLWVQILFDQGWLGLITFTIILLHLLIRLYKNILKGDYFSAIILSSITGFLVVGVTDSPFDMPMITLLFFLIYFVLLLDTNKNQGTIYPDN